jgi:hypothetical protein
MAENEEKTAVKRRNWDWTQKMLPRRDAIVYPFSILSNPPISTIDLAYRLTRLSLPL